MTMLVVNCRRLSASFIDAKGRRDKKKAITEVLTQLVQTLWLRLQSRLILNESEQEATFFPSFLLKFRHVFVASLFALFAIERNPARSDENKLTQKKSN